MMFGADGSAAPRPSSATPSSASAAAAAVASGTATTSGVGRGRGDRWGGAGEGGGGASASAAVTLEQILMHNFHDNRVEGLHRSVSGEKGIQVGEREKAVVKEKITI